MLGDIEVDLLEDIDGDPEADILGDLLRLLLEEAEGLAEALTEDDNDGETEEDADGLAEEDKLGDLLKLILADREGLKLTDGLILAETEGEAEELIEGDADGDIEDDFEIETLGLTEGEKLADKEGLVDPIDGDTLELTLGEADGL